MLAAARAARAAGRADDALALARDARARLPGEPEPLFLLCCLLLDRHDAAANDLLPLLEDFPGFAPGWEDIGQALLAGHEDAARIAFGRAAEGYAAMEARRPGAAIVCRLGMVLRRLGRLQAARDALCRATARDPAAAHAWFALGLVCQDSGDDPGAAEAFRAALSAQPDLHEAAFNLGVACQGCGAPGEAMDAYARAWRLRPDTFGRIAQALSSGAAGRIWLHPSALRRELAGSKAGLCPDPPLLQGGGEPPWTGLG